MTTNILALPVATLSVQVGNNEDWVDSIKFVVDDGTEDTMSMPQLDLRGIKFDMEIRHKAEDHEVVITASTDDNKLIIGEYPDYGFLIIMIDDSIMRAQRTGTYVGDIIATDDEFTRRCLAIDLTILEGVTK